MAEIRIALSTHQQALFAAFAQEEAQVLAPLVAKRNAAVTAVIGASHDPASMKDWRIEIQGDAIVCIPPVDSGEGPE